jgi:hypothetical protein
VEVYKIDGFAVCSVLTVLVSYETAGKYWYSGPPPWIFCGISRINGASCVGVESRYNIVSQTVGHGLPPVHGPFFAHKVIGIGIIFITVQRFLLSPNIFLHKNLFSYGISEDILKS